MRQLSVSDIEDINRATAIASAILHAVGEHGRTFKDSADTFVRALDKSGYEVVPKAAMGNVVALTPAGEDAIRRFVDAVDLTQDAVSAGGADLERRIEADPDRYLRDVSGRDHAVDPRALAVRDTIEANRLLGMAVATLGHEAVDTLMRNLPEPVLEAA
ncbi:hypothetical protein [Methylobacterium flocculans]|uniref:hypothetical protein n=1 Tax=Methylobacterium flocculans TaxID=2984843 RepID=UPI0021F39D1A|nr:hypothetical protein [Methylobacterium sp. FF17]